jgi:hypothetical protein
LLVTQDRHPFARRKIDCRNPDPPQITIGQLRDLLFQRRFIHRIKALRSAGFGAESAVKGSFEVALRLRCGRSSKTESDGWKKSGAALCEFFQSRMHIRDATPVMVVEGLTGRELLSQAG